MAATHSFTPNTRPAAGPRVDLCVAFAECRHAFFAIVVFGAAPRLHVRGLSVRIRVPDSELQRLDGSQPIVGTVGTFVETARRTVMAYLMQSIREQVERTFRTG